MAEASVSGDCEGLNGVISNCLGVWLTKGGARAACRRCSAESCIGYGIVALVRCCVLLQISRRTRKQLGELTASAYGQWLLVGCSQAIEEPVVCQERSKGKRAARKKWPPVLKKKKDDVLCMCTTEDG